MKRRSGLFTVAAALAIAPVLRGDVAPGYLVAERVWNGSTPYWDAREGTTPWSPEQLPYHTQLRSVFHGASYVVQAGRYFVRHDGGWGYTQSWDNEGIVTPNAARTDVLRVEADVLLNMNFGPLVVGDPDWARLGTTSRSSTALDVGFAGLGLLTVANARRNDSAPPRGDFFISESTHFAGVGIGQLTGSDGALALRNSDALIDGRLVVGNAGAGKLTVTDGSKVYVTGQSFVGESIGGDGQIHVSGRSGTALPSAPAAYAQELGGDYWPVGYLGTDHYAYIDANSAPIAPKSLLRFNDTLTLGGTSNSSGGVGSVTIDEDGRVEIRAQATVLEGSKVVLKKNAELDVAETPENVRVLGRIEISDEATARVTGTNLVIGSSGRVQVELRPDLAHAAGATPARTALRVTGGRVEFAEGAKVELKRPADNPSFRAADNTFYKLVAADTINGRADHAGRTIDLDGQAVSVQYGRNASGVNVKSLAKYKQFSAGWGNKVISQGIMQDYGCTITSLAVVAGMYGRDVSPLQMLNYVKSNGLVDTNDNLNVDGWHYDVTSSDGQSVRLDTGARGGNWQTIASKLWDGEPLMLGVPSRTTAGAVASGTGGTFGSNNKVHYLVAYGVRSDLAPGATLTPSDIYIIDPGYGSTAYAGTLPNYGSIMDPDNDGRADETFNITLQNYFDMVNDHRDNAQFTNLTDKLQFDPLEWFNNKRFFSLNNALDGAPRVFELNPTKRGQLVTTFTDDEANAAPSIGVNSPVELILVDPATGVRYVSSADLLNPGDVLLVKSFYDEPAPVDSINELPDSLPTAFPHYSVALPSELLGRSLEVQVLGVGAGAYRVNYYTGSNNFNLLGAPLSGSIEQGQSVLARFDVTAIPEPALMAVQGVLMMGLLRRFRSTTKGN